MYATIDYIYSIYSKTPIVTTDTRKIDKNCIFFALKGENFNGNKFAKQALESGASYAVVDEKEYAIDKRFILVEDVLQTLQELAKHHRNKFNIPIIGITGTNGKTTSKELLKVVLDTTFKTHCTAGNFNNHIGVPLTLLSMPLNTEIAIIEMGANHIGDIEFLCNIANPTLGFITNIGKAHLEGFGSLEGVARTKSELFKHLKDNNGVTFINGQSDILMRMASRLNNPLVYSYKDKKAYCFGELLEVNPFIKMSYNHEKNKQTQLIGQYNFENILASLAVAKHLKIEDKLAIDAICNYNSSNNRSQVIQKESNKILLDAYNANPTSMKAAIDNFEAIKHSHKIVILGDMFELGKYAQEEHKNLLNYVKDKGFNGNYFIGKNFKDIAQNDENVFIEKTSLINKLKSKPLENALILVKGSRGIGLESILDYL